MTTSISSPPGVVSKPRALPRGSARRGGALALAGLLVAAPIGVFLAEAWPVTHYLGVAYPPGQAAYMMMRPVGAVALVLIFLQIVLGAGDRNLARWLGMGSLAGVHRQLGMAAFGLAFLHPALFLWGRSLRTGSIEVGKTFWPQPTDYYHTQLFIGALALYVLTLGVIAGRYGPRFAPRWWRRLHRVNYVVFFAAGYHGFFIGSDTRSPVLAVLYPVLALVAGGLLAWRFIRATREPAAAGQGRAT